MKMSPKNNVWMLMLLVSMTLILPPQMRGTSGGQNSLTFLNLESGGRPMGMAGAYTACATDVNSLFYNPGGLGSLKNTEVLLGFSSYLANMSYSAGAVALPLKNFGTIAGSVFVLQGPPIDAYDENDRPIGSFTVSDYAYTLGYGLELNDDLSVGLALKMAQEIIDIDSASAFSVDLGLVYQLSSWMQAGLYFGNIGQPVKFRSVGSDQAALLRLGVATSTLDHHLLIDADLTKDMDDDPEIRMGGEYRVLSFLALRTGYAYDLNDRMLDGLAGLYTGVGFYYDTWKLDYALSLWGDLGMSHLASLSYGFSTGRGWGQQEGNLAPHKQVPGVPAKTPANLPAGGPRGGYSPTATPLPTSQPTVTPTPTPVIRHKHRPTSTPTETFTPLPTATLTPDQAMVKKLSVQIEKQREAVQEIQRRGYGSLVTELLSQIDADLDEASQAVNQGNFDLTNDKISKASDLVGQAHSKINDELGGAIRW